MTLKRIAAVTWLAMCVAASPTQAAEPLKLRGFAIGDALEKTCDQDQERANYLRLYKEARGSLPLDPRVADITTCQLWPDDVGQPMTLDALRLIYLDERLVQIKAVLLLPAGEELTQWLSALVTAYGSPQSRQKPAKLVQRWVWTSGADELAVTFDIKAQTATLLLRKPAAAATIERSRQVVLAALRESLTAMQAFKLREK